jgi:DNA topoisomerase-1
VLNHDQSRLYELIWQRALASQMTNAQLERTVVEIEVAVDDGSAIFEARGQRVVFPGYLRAYTAARDESEPEDDERLLPAVAAGDIARLETLEPKQHETQPPARFTEASLVRRLEEDGLGRPSTYAAILGTIQDRGYSFKQGNALVPTFVAYAVTDLLENHFPDLVEPDFTASMESVLDAIARGEADSVSHLRTFYHGADDEPGLASRIETVVPDIPFPNLPVGDDPATGTSVVVRVGRFGPYLQRGEGGQGNTVSLPDDLPPAELTIERAVELLDAKQDGPRDLGHDPETGVEVLLLTGRFGPYVQLGPNPESGTKKAAKPKRASVPPDEDLDQITLEDALLWLSLPRTLGEDPETKTEVIATNGRFGAYIKRDSDTRSLTDSDDIYTIELPRALELLAQPKAAGFRRRASAKVLVELGEHPDSGKPVRILDGRYGPYATDGETNASLPRGADPADTTLEQALTLIAERAAAPKRGKRAAKKRATTKAGKKATKRKSTKARKTSAKKSS